jgi:hypothetical protein
MNNRKLAAAGFLLASIFQTALGAPLLELQKRDEIAKQIIQPDSSFRAFAKLYHSTDCMNLALPRYLSTYSALGYTLVNFKAELTYFPYVGPLRAFPLGYTQPEMRERLTLFLKFEDSEKSVTEAQINCPTGKSTPLE